MNDSHTQGCVHEQLWKFATYAPLKPVRQFHTFSVIEPLAKTLGLLRMVFGSLAGLLTVMY